MKQKYIQIWLDKRKYYSTILRKIIMTPRIKEKLYITYIVFSLNMENLY